MAVPPHELSDRLAHLSVGQGARRSQRPKHEPGRRDKRDDAEQADRERQLSRLVAKVERTGCQARRATASRSHADGPEPGAAAATAATETVRVAAASAGTRQIADRSRTGSPRTQNASRPHQSSPGARRRQRRLLDIQALDDVEHGRARREGRTRSATLRVGGAGDRTRRRAVRPTPARRARERRAWRRSARPGGARARASERSGSAPRGG